MSTDQFTVSKPPSKLSSGFTLIEMMVVIMIVGILASLAAPSFTNAFDRYRVSSAVDEFNTTLQFARVEAIRSGRQVVIRRNVGCPVGNWGCGWTVFQDLNANLTQDGDVVTGNEPTIRTIDVQPNVSITSNTPTPDTIAINNFGQTPNANRTMRFGPIGNATSVGCTSVTISIGLRLRNTRGAGECP